MEASRELLLRRLQVALGPDYAVDREIGAGGMGVVFAARDLRLDRPVAVKVLRPEQATAVALERFTREARLLARLAHPNIVPVHTAGGADSLRYYVMDLETVPTLEQRLRRGPLPAREVVAVGRAILAGLGHAHARGVLHRDVKPSNVFLDGPASRLADFGIARGTAASEDSLTATGSTVGTPGYIAPELRDAGAATARSDLYMAAESLYEAATGRAWQSLTPSDDAWGPVPPPLRRALRRGLAAAPARRWSDARTFSRALGSRRRWRMVALPVLGVVLLSGAVLAIHPPDWWPPEIPSHASLPSNPVADLAVLPFAGGPGALGRELQRYVTSDLEWFPRIRVVPAARVLADSGVSDRLQARLRITGSLNEPTGSSVLVLETRDSTDHLVSRIEVPGDTANPLAWAAAAADSLVAGQWPGDLAEFRELASHGSRDLPAVRALIAGEDAFELGDWERSEADLRRALAREPDFPRALWSLALVREWRRLPADSQFRALVDRTASGAIPELYRRLVAAQLEPDLRRRIATLDSLDRANPSNGAAGFLALNELFHRGALVGIPLRSALDRVERDLAAPDYGARSLVDQTVWGLIRIGDRTRARAELERRLALAAATPAGSEARSRSSLLRLAFAARFAPFGPRLVTEYILATSDSARLTQIAAVFRLGGVPFGLPDLEWRLGEGLARRAPTDSLRANAFVGQALGLVALGRPAAALARLDSATALLPTPEMRLQQAEWPVLLPALGVPGIPPEATARGADRLRALLQDPVLGGRAAAALAVAAAAGGDTATLAAMSVRLRAFPTAHRWSAIVDALREAAGGDVAGAVARTGGLRTDDSSGAESRAFGRAVLYLTRAEWLVRLGRLAQADSALVWCQNSDMAGWPANEAQAGEIDAMLCGPAMVRRAELAALRHQPRAFCGALERERSLWRGAEAGFLPLRARLDGALARCRP